MVTVSSAMRRYRSGVVGTLSGAASQRTCTRLADDKTIQTILRHSTIGLTQNIYIKSVNELQVSALDSLSEKFEICNDHATNLPRVIQ